MHPQNAIQSYPIKILDKNDIWKNIASQISDFSEDDYQRLPLILEQNIPTIQSHIQSGSLSYETLTQWYLYRIVKYENDKDKMLNAIVAINPEAVNEARERENKSNQDHPIYGIPILVKTIQTWRVCLPRREHIC
jgi:amidase